MKKIFLLATILLSVVSCSTAFANSMPREEMCVGSVGYGCTLGNVKAIYGEPLERRIFDGIDAHGSTWIYSPNFSVTGRTSGSWQLEEDLPVVNPCYFGDIEITQKNDETIFLISGDCDRDFALIED